MATKIIHKKSSVAASVPASGDIEAGELAVNLADKKLYSKQTDGTVIAVGVSNYNDLENLPADFTPEAHTHVKADITDFDETDYVAVTGDSMTGNLSFGDNDKATFGAGSDLQIYHDGSHSLIRDAGTGHLKLQGTNLKLQNANGDNYVDCIDGSYVRLNHNASTKLETTSTGIDVTGTVTADGLDINGAAKLNSNSAEGLQLGGDAAGSTLIGNLKNTSGRLTLQAPTSRRVAIQTNGATDRILVDNNGDISFYEDTGTTAKLTWDASDEALEFADNAKATFGAGSDLQIYHDSSASYIKENGAGSLFIQSDGVGIVLEHTDGTNLLFADAGNQAVTLYNGGSAKLATTSTGIDVTGEVVADTAHFGTGTGTGPTVADEVVVSGSGSTGLTIHSPDANNATLAFGSDTDSDYGFLQGFYNSGSPFIRASIQNSEVAKFTSTGINVAGTVTADGLAVDGNTALNGITTFTDDNVRLDLMESDTTDVNSRIQSSSGSMLFRTINDAKSSATTRMAINNATGDISFYEDTGTTPKFFWDASEERLGLGTTTPTNVLEINQSRTGTVATEITNTHATGSGSARLILNNSSDTNANGFHIINNGSDGVVNLLNYKNTPLALWTNASEKMRIDSSGNVGIGTSSPSAVLHTLSSAAGSQTGAVLSNYDTTAGTSQAIQLDFGLARNSGALKPSAGRIAVGRSDDWTNDDAKVDAFMSFSTYNNNALSEAMRIDSSGNVGIGTSWTAFAEGSGLRIERDATATLRLQDTGAHGFEIRATADAAEFFSANSKPFTFETAGSEAMRIDSSGNVGIGTSSPTAPLSLENASFGSDAGTTSSTTETTIATFPKANFDAAKFVVMANDGTDTFCCEILVVHDGTTASATEYAQVSSNDDFQPFYEVDISGNDVRLRATAQNSTSTTYKVMKTLL